MTATTAAPAWVADLMETLGAPGAGLAIALENLFPPLPSEVILPLAGFAASTGQMGLLAALLWTTAGSVVGALALYGVGALLGRDRTVALAGRLPLVKVADIEKTEAWFLRHGTKAVFFGRMIPVFRSLISVPAGVERMPLPVFLGLTTLGSALWNTAFVCAGYLLGDNWAEVTTVVSAYSKVVLAGAAVAVAVFVAVRIARTVRRRAQGGLRQIPSGSPASPEPPESQESLESSEPPQSPDSPAPPSSPAGAPAGSAPPPRPPVREAR